MTPTQNMGNDTLHDNLKKLSLEKERLSFPIVCYGHQLRLQGCKGGKLERRANGEKVPFKVRWSKLSSVSQHTVSHWWSKLGDGPARIMWYHLGPFLASYGGVHTWGYHHLWMVYKGNSYQNE